MSQIKSMSKHMSKLKSTPKIALLSTLEHDKSTIISMPFNADKNCQENLKNLPYEVQDEGQSLADIIRKIVKE